MNNKFNVLLALILLFNTVQNSYSSENNNKQLLNANNYSVETSNNNIEIQQNSFNDSDDENNDSSINSNISRKNNRSTLFKKNCNRTIHLLNRSLKGYKNSDGIDKIKELTNTKITEIKNIKFEVEDNVFSVMNQYIEILLSLKNELQDNCSKIQKKLYTNLFRSINNCIYISKNNLIKMASLPSYEMAMLSPYNSNSYLIAFHEYDYYFYNNCNENNGLSFFDDDCDKNLVSVSEIKKPTTNEIFESTHNYVTSELEDNIINNSRYKYLDKLQSKVYNVLDKLNKIKSKSSNNVSDNYTEYLNVINDLPNFELKRYINITEIENTINNIINIVSDRRRYIIREEM